MLEGLSKAVTGMAPSEVREEFMTATSSDMKRRRTIIGLSMVGLGIAAAASLLQTGVISHLPDPPVGNFDADKVMRSDDAYQFGVPDAAIALTGFAANVPLAAWGSADRVHDRPMVPLIAAGKSAVEALAAGWYFYRMPTKLKTWCGYCIVSAGVYAAIFALTLPEAKKAWAEITTR